MKKVLLLLIAVAIAAVTISAQEESYLKPVDEASQDPSFLAFRTKLIAAVDRKDAAYVYSIVDPKIRNGFGDRDTIAWFKRDWKLENKNSKFWKTFGTVIKNGGAFWSDGTNKNSFVAPYSYSNWPDGLDAFDHSVIFGTDVNLPEEPTTTGKVVAKLSYNLIQVEHETLPKSGRSEYPGWKKVKTLGGLEGFVKEEFIRSSVDYRAGFEKKRGKWMMTFFLAGD
jgi:hypothetical protein